MSAAKMVADSTQSDEPATKKNKINVKKNKKGKKAGEKKNKKKTAKEESTDPYLDLNKEVRPIGDYWKEPGEMLDQMFDSVQGPSLNMILPEVLMELDIKELKSQCLEHLEVMSRKRIFRILAGDEPDTISSSGTEDEAEVPTKFSNTCIGSGNQQAADSTSTSDFNKSNEKLDENEDNSNMKNQTDKDKEGNDSQNISNSAQQTQATSGKLTPDADGESEDEEETVIVESNTNIEMKKVDSPEEGECSPGPKTESDSGELIPMLTQNHMELLELEMRARAIKAMLKAQESHESHAR